MIDWTALFEWVGYDFVGVLLSLFGGFYAYFANKNAKKASLAAEIAVKRVSSVDAISELAQAQSRLREIRVRLDQEHWDRASEGCADIAVLIARVTSALEDSWPEALRVEIGKAKQSNLTLSGLIDSTMHRKTDIDLAKAKVLLGQVEEIVAGLHVQLREKVNQYE